MKKPLLLALFTPIMMCLVDVDAYMVILWLALVLAGVAQDKWLKQP